MSVRPTSLVRDDAEQVAVRAITRTCALPPCGSGAHAFVEVPVFGRTRPRWAHYGWMRRGLLTAVCAASTLSACSPTHLLIGAAIGAAVGGPVWGGLGGNVERASAPSAPSLEERRVEALIRVAARAAKEGDCGRVLRLQADLRQLSPDVNTNNFVQDPSIAVCLGLETKRQHDEADTSRDACLAQRIEISQRASMVQDSDERGRLLLGMPVCEPPAQPTSEQAQGPAMKACGEATTNSCDAPVPAARIAYCTDSTNGRVHVCEDTLEGCASRAHHIEVLGGAMSGCVATTIDGVDAHGPQTRVQLVARVHQDRRSGSEIAKDFVTGLLAGAALGLLGAAVYDTASWFNQPHLINWN